MQTSITDPSPLHRAEPEPAARRRPAARRPGRAMRQRLLWGGLAAVLLVALVLWGLSVGQALRGSLGGWDQTGWQLSGEPTGAQQRPAPGPLDSGVTARGAAGPSTAEARPAASARGARPAPLESDSQVAAQVLPKPIALARHQRDPEGAARQAALDQATGNFGLQLDAGATAEHLRFRDAEGRTGSADMSRANISEADLGMPLLPGSQLLPQESMRLIDPGSGTQLAVALRSPVPPAEAVAFYRAQLGRQSRPGEALVQVQQLAPNQSLIIRTVLLDGAQQTVLISPEGSGTLVRLVRLMPPAAAQAKR